MYVCACFCVCMCAEALQLKQMGRFWWHFLQMIWQIFARSFFSDFENSKSMTSWRPFCIFAVPALSWSHFLFDFLQIRIQVTKLLSTVCYWKSEKSVDKFWRNNGPRFRKKSKMAAKNKIFEFVQVRCLHILIQTCRARICYYFVDWKSI